MLKKLLILSSLVVLELCAQTVTPPAPTSLPPSGAAGGDLAGTYPNPTVDGINGAAVPASAPLVGTNGSSQIALASPFATNAKTAMYQVLAADFAGYKTINVASGTFDVTLVASGAQPATGQSIRVINYGSGVVTIARSGQNINGGTTSLTLPAASATAPTDAWIVSDGANYFATVGGFVAPASPANSIQYNNAGAFGGSADLVFAADGLTLGRKIAIGAGSTIDQSYAGASNNVIDNIQVTPSDFSKDYIMGRMTLLNVAPAMAYSGEVRGLTTTVNTSGSSNLEGVASAYYEVYLNNSGNADVEGVASIAESDGAGTGTLRAFSASVRALGTNTMSETAALDVGGQVGAMATVTNLRGIYIRSPSISGTVTTLCGICLDNHAGAGTNYAIKTGTGLVDFGDQLKAPLYSSTTNCADSAGAAACGAAPAGRFVADAAATSVVVSTTAVTADSEIFVHYDSSLSTALGVTCNATIPALYAVTARTAGTSFTLTTSANVTNPGCYSYHIIN